MYHGEKFKLSQFPKDLYRFHIEAQRAHDRKRGVDTVTTVSLEKGASKTEHAAVLDRTLPLDLSGITRIFRLDDVRNDGEGVTIGGRAYPERQLLRIVAELDDEGEVGVMAVTLDRLYGTVGFRFRYKSWGGTEVGDMGRPIAELLHPDSYPKLLALYRLCELLDADDEIGGHGLYRQFIAEALSRPEGFGFPKFTAGVGRHLLGCYRDCPPVGTRVSLKGFERHAWYARGFRDRNRPLDENLYFYVGQVEVLSWQQDRPLWSYEETDRVLTKIAYENGGYGRAIPESEYYLGDIWVNGDDRFFRIAEAAAAEIRSHVVKPPSDTSKIMAECLAAL